LARGSVADHAIGFRFEWSAQPIAESMSNRELATARSRSGRSRPELRSRRPDCRGCATDATDKLYADLSLRSSRTIRAGRGPGCGRHGDRRERLQLSRAQIVWATLIASCCLPCAGNHRAFGLRRQRQRVSLPEVVAALSGAVSDACRRDAASDARGRAAAHRRGTKPRCNCRRRRTPDGVRADQRRIGIVIVGAVAGGGWCPADRRRTRRRRHRARAPPAPAFRAPDRSGVPPVVARARGLVVDILGVERGATLAEMRPATSSGAPRWGGSRNAPHRQRARRRRTRRVEGSSYSRAPRTLKIAVRRETPLALRAPHGTRAAEGGRARWAR